MSNLWPRGCIRLRTAKNNYRCGPTEITNILKMLSLLSLRFCNSVAGFSSMSFVGDDPSQSLKDGYAWALCMLLLV